MATKLIPHSKPTLDDTDELAVLRVLRENHLEEGSFVREVERYFEIAFGRSHANAVSSGFAGIHLSLKALDIRNGDEVMLPSYACPALLNPILLLGGNPIVLDVAVNSFNITAEIISKKITNKTKAIIVPHIFGFPAAIDEIATFNIPVIEDCAQSLGGSLNGRKLGAFGDLSVFSFYATKMIAAGDGGMIVTNNNTYDEVIKNYRYYGARKSHRFVAYNYHLTNLPAALALNQIKRIKNFVARRKQIAQLYDELLENEKGIHLRFEGKDHAVYYRYPVQLLDRNIEKVKAAMKNKGILCGYGVLEGMHQLLQLPSTEFPNTVSLLNSILSLPIYPSLTDESAAYIAHSLKQIILKTT